MALTEIQKPDKLDFYANVRAIAIEVKRVQLRWNEASEFLAGMGAADMDAMGIPAGQIRTDLANFRTALEEVVSLLGGSAVAPTNNPEAVMDKLRQMLVV